MTFLEEIKQQPQVLQKVYEFYCSKQGNSIFEKINTIYKSQECTNILFTGMGSSYFLSGAASLMLSALDIPVSWEDSGELLHYGMGHLAPGTLVCMISQSGESYEIKAILEKIKQNKIALSGIIGITNNQDSILATQADIVLPIFAGPEYMTSSKTFVATYLVILLMSRYLQAKPLALEAWDQMQEQFQNILCAHDGYVELKTFANFFADTRFVQCIARGPLMAVSSQTALMYMEVDKISASSMTGGNFRHGPLESVAPGFISVLFTHSESGTLGQSLKLAKDILQNGGEVLMISDSTSEIESDRFHEICIPCSNSELMPILSIIPMQLIINQIAINKNLEPGTFSIGNKITGIE